MKGCSKLEIDAESIQVSHLGPMRALLTPSRVLHLTTGQSVRSDSTRHYEYEYDVHLLVSVDVPVSQTGLTQNVTVAVQPARSLLPGLC